ncbi:hypothetical protein HAX54_013382, partial [Datura stramonium]|nr:hypothetical protein [Datura stramonium]
MTDHKPSKRLTSGTSPNVHFDGYVPSLFLITQLHGENATAVAQADRMKLKKNKKYITGSPFKKFFEETYFVAYT